MAHMSPRLKMRRGRFGLGGFKEPTLVISGPDGVLVFGAGLGSPTGSPLTIGNFTGFSVDDLQGDISALITWSVQGPGYQGAGSPSKTTFGSPTAATGASVDLSSVLVQGVGSPQLGPTTYNVVARSVDSGGKTATRTLAVILETVADYKPNLTIVSPASGAVFGGSPEVAIPNFVATAVDEEDGNIAANIEWFVNGPGSPISTVFGSPQQGSPVPVGASVDLSAFLVAAPPPFAGSPTFGSPLTVGSPPLRVGAGSPFNFVGSPRTRVYTVIARITDSGNNRKEESITITVLSTIPS